MSFTFGRDRDEVQCFTTKTRGILSSFHVLDNTGSYGSHCSCADPCFLPRLSWLTQQSPAPTNGSQTVFHVSACASQRSSDRSNAQQLAFSTKESARVRHSLSRPLSCCASGNGRGVWTGAVWTGAAWPRAASVSGRWRFWAAPDQSIRGMPGAQPQKLRCAIARVPRFRC